MGCAIGGRMQRRQFIKSVAGAALAWPRAATAQPSATPVIGFLTSNSRAGAAPYIRAVASGLAEAGYSEPGNLKIEYRFADDDMDRLPALAKELVERKVSVIVSSAIAASRAAKAATSTIPVVFATANDPIKFGLVTSLNQPGGNMTGVTYLSAQLGEKRLELLHELLPAASAIAALVNPNNLNADRNLQNLHGAALNMGLHVDVLKASNEAELEPAISKAASVPSRALVLLNDPLFFDLRDGIVKLAARHAIPAMYSAREFVEAGGLVSYGANQSDAYRLVGIYVGRI